MDLKEYYISDEVGFLLEDPMEFLPPYYDNWNKLAKNMVEHLDEHCFRELVHQMPLLDHTKLVGHRQKRLAQLQLSIIAMGYVWQEGKQDVPSKLPACLAVPLWRISQDLDIPPIGGHANIFLANWQRKDVNGPITIANVRCLYSLPGGEDSDNFSVMLCVMEAQFAPALKAIVTGIQCISRGDEAGLIQAMGAIQMSLTEMTKTFSHIHELTRPEIFFTKLLPCYGGYGGEKSPIPDGMIFEGISDEPVKLYGDTGAQTSILPSVDAFLGIQHDPGHYKFLHELRSFMPTGHRQFIETLEKLPSARDLVIKTTNGDLKKVYDDCVQATTEFRNYHIQVVAKYVILQERKQQESEQTTKGPTGSGEGYPMSFLKYLRNETVDHKYNNE